MTSEKDLREQLATCTRIFAMQGMIGVFGHVSVYQPDIKRVLITPGMGSDKGNLRPRTWCRRDLDSKPLEGSNGPPVEWPIRSASMALALMPSPSRTCTPLCDALRDREAEFRRSLCRGDLQRWRTAVPEAQLITTPPRQRAAKGHKR
jgi:hypothetical protein